MYIFIYINNNEKCGEGGGSGDVIAVSWSRRLSFGFFRCRRGGAAGRLGSWLGVLDDRDLRVLKLYAGLAVEHGTTFRERGGLVGLLGQLALGVGLGVRAAVLDQLQKTVGALALHARGTSAERRQLPCVSGFNGGAFGRRETQSGEICGTQYILLLIELHDCSFVMLHIIYVS